MFKKLKIIKQFINTMTFKDREALQAHQSRKIDHLLKNLKGDFYPKGVPLEQFPIINKKIFMENFERINTVGLTKERAFEMALKAEESRDFSATIGDTTIGLSSGTSGSRGLFLVSEDESAIWAGYILKRMLPKPLLQQHRIAFFLRANSNLYESVKSLLIKFSFYDLINPLETHIETLNKNQPTILIAPAQVLRLLAQNPTLNISPTKVISVAEVLADDDRLIIEKRFGKVLHQIYQCTEGFLAHTCEAGNLHLNEDIVHIEKAWLDADKKRFSPIITDFNRTSQPLIRYKLDDILVIAERPCSCGSVFTHIEKIEGRCDEILTFETQDGKSYLLYPDFLTRAIITADTDIEAFTLQFDGKKLEVFLAPLSAKDAVEHSLQKLYITHNLKAPQHQFHPYTSVPLTQKRRRVIKL